MAALRRSVPFGATSHVATERLSLPAGLDPQMHDALTDLHIYALALDAEREELGDPVMGLLSTEAAALGQRRAEISEEREALRATVIALRACADPAGTRL